MTHIVNRPPSVLAIAAILTVLAAATDAPAVLVVNNLGGSTVSSERVGVGSGTWCAIPFTTGPGLWSLNSITVRLTEISDHIGTTIAFQIRNNDGGHPSATVVGAFDMTGTDVGSINNYTFPPTAPLQLAGGNTYWLTALPTASDSYFWHLTQSADNGVLGWSIGNVNLYSADMGSSWNSNGTLPPKLSIDATAAPEPTTLVLVGLASAALPTRRRKSTSQNRI